MARFGEPLFSWLDNGIADEASLTIAGMTAVTESSVLQQHAHAWTDLWRRGVLHACASGIEGNYDGSIAAFWAGCFGRLAAQARVLDLATGNGALALLAKQYGLDNNRQFEIHGIDIAQINPLQSLDCAPDLMSGICFHSGVDMARLPFADGSMDFLMSQYGFEYAPSRSDVIKAMLRVLAPGGAIAMLMHSSDSIVARMAPVQLQGIDYLLEGPLLDNLQAIALLMAEARDTQARQMLAKSPEAEAARNTFNQSVEALLKQIQLWPQAHVLQQAVLHVRRVLELASAGNVEAVYMRLSDWRAGLEAERLRLQHLMSALLDDSAIADIAQGFVSAGLQVEINRLWQKSDALMGWTLVARHE